MRGEAGVSLDVGVAQAYAQAMPRAAHAGKAFKSAFMRSLHKSELARFVPFIPTRHYEGLRRMPFPLTRVPRRSWRPSYVIQNTSNECSGLANGLSGACTQSAGLGTW